MMPEKNFQHINRQRGATLIVALVILTIMTLIGISNLKSSSFQTQMARYSENREQTFMLAESTLKYAEAEVNNDLHILSRVQDCAANSTDCYDEACAGGWCFNGTYRVGDHPWDCELGTATDSGGDPYDPYWTDGSIDVWASDSLHREGPTDGYPGFPEPKYIVEFLCYSSVDVDAGQECDSVDANDDDCIALYRITSFATSRDEKAKVMLQSIIRVENL